MKVLMTINVLHNRVCMLMNHYQKIVPLLNFINKGNQVVVIGGKISFLQSAENLHGLLPQLCCSNNTSQSQQLSLELNIHDSTNELS